MPTQQHTSDAMPVADRRPIADSFRRMAHGAVAICTKWRVHPNTVSYSSIVVSGMAGILFALSGYETWLLIPACLLCYARLYLNMLDGMVALATNQASATGEIANELPDRVSDVLIFGGVASSGLCFSSFGYWAAIGSLLVAYVGTLGKATGANREFSGPMSKPWRMVALSVGSVIALCTPTFESALRLTPLDITCLAIAGGCLLTCIRRLRRIVATLDALENATQRDPSHDQ